MTAGRSRKNESKPSLPYLADFTVYHSKEEFEGTCYMEIKPSKYTGKCWERGSISIEEEAFGIFEWAFLKHIRHYDHYGFIDVTSRVMLKVAKDLEEFEKMVVGRKPMKEFRTNCQMATEYLENDLARALRYQRTELIAATSEISRWIRDRATETKHFAILGI